MRQGQRILVTGASGKLGRAVIASLLERVEPGFLVAGLRTAAGEAAGAFADMGVEARLVDYDRPDTLSAAFADVGRLLLISSNAPTGRVAQHAAVIEAARFARVEQIAYTSILHADISPLALARDHRETEAALRASGLPSVILRNGWYVENYRFWVGRGLREGVIAGTAGDGLIAAAARADYAVAAAAVMSGDGHAGRVYELAGDRSFTMRGLAEQISAASGRPVRYDNLDRGAFEDLLRRMSVPEGMAAMLADIDAGTAAGALDDTSGDLHRLIGRPTIPLSAAIATMVAEVAP